MKNQTRWIVLSVVLTAVALLTAISVRAAPSAPSAPLGTGFTYQGKLEDESGPVSADCDMEFRLYSHATNPSQVGSTIAATVPISNGLFTVELDFGTSAFDGEGRWLGIQVSCPGDSGFTDLGRQELTAAPYALYALRVGPHEHWGESWTGTGTGLSLSGGTRGVYGSGSGSGVEGYSSSGFGVFGEGATGVSGTSDSGYGVHGEGILGGVYGTSNDGPGVRGISYASGGASIGVSGAGSAYGVRGEGAVGVYGTSVAAYGVQGNSADNYGIYGNSSGSGYAGVLGSNSGSYGYGVEGEGAGSYAGVYGHSTDGHGVDGSSTNSYGVDGSSTNSYGVYGTSSASNYAGVYGSNSNSYGYGVRGKGNTYGVYGTSDSGNGVYGTSSASGYAGVLGTNSSSYGYGVEGEGAGSYAGVYGHGPYRGVYGYSDDAGVEGRSSSGFGVYGTSDTGSAAVAAYHESILGTALYIIKGSIRVGGAGEDTGTPVFIHKVRTGAGGNICSVQNYATVIDHPMLNSQAGAILIVTPNYGPASSGTLVRQPYGVYYDDTNQCGFGAGMWVIYGYGVAPASPLALVNNQLFNVMVVLP